MSVCDALANVLVVPAEASIRMYARDRVADARRGPDTEPGRYSQCVSGGYDRRQCLIDQVSEAQPDGTKSVRSAEWAETLARWTSGISQTSLTIRVVHPDKQLDLRIRIDLGLSPAQREH